MPPGDPARLAAERRGRRAEWLSRLALRLRGWRIVDTNWRSPRGSRAGEIDIVAARRKMLVFVEVKARESETAAAAAVSPAQQRRIARGAEAYLAAHPEYADHDLRFDVVLVQPWHWPRWITDAWRPSERP